MTIRDFNVLAQLGRKVTQPSMMRPMHADHMFAHRNPKVGKKSFRNENTLPGTRPASPKLGKSRPGGFVSYLPRKKRRRMETPIFLNTRRK